MALALYRKYRPRTFAEVIGQEHVTEPLSQALRSGRLHHAYLFSGPRGCGKTSSARILARSLNCEQGPTPEPCGQCLSCRSLANDGAGSIDVIEIDAASHGGVDDARELREKAFYAPANSRFKIYVIDEAHMVSSAGFNALLKLVEEPPEYVKFIFATTEPEKVLGTIRSRTHHYPFRLIPPAVLRPYLVQLCEAEGVSVDPAVFPLVVRAGGGSARDTLSVLDQLIAGAGPEGVEYTRAVALLGVTDVALIDEMCDALAAGDGAAAYATIDRVAEAGHDPRRFASDLLERLRDLIILQQVPDAVAKGLIDGPADEMERMTAQAARLGPATLSRCADIVHNGLVEMRGTTAPRLLLELVTARMLLPGAEDSTGALLQRLERMERRLTLGADAAGSANPDNPGVRATPAPAAGRSDAPPPSTGPGGGIAAARAAVASARQAPVTAAGTTASASAPPAGEAAPGGSTAPDAPARPSAESVPATSTDPASSGPASSGPASSGPASSGPASSGPASSGPASSGPASSGLASSGPAPSGPGPGSVGSLDAGAAAGARWSGAGPDVAVEEPLRDRAPDPAAVMPDPPVEPGIEPVAAAPAGQLSAAAIRETWPEIMTMVSRQSKKIAALASGAVVRDLDGQTVVLTFRFPAHARMVAAQPELLADALYETLGGRWQIRCEVAGDGAASGPARATPSGGGAVQPAAQPSAPSPRGPRSGGAADPTSAGPTSAGPTAGGATVGGPTSGGPASGRRPSGDPAANGPAANGPAADGQSSAGLGFVGQGPVSQGPTGQTSAGPGQIAPARGSSDGAPDGGAAGEDDWPEPARPGGLAPAGRGSVVAGDAPSGVAASPAVGSAAVGGGRTAAPAVSGGLAAARAAAAGAGNGRATAWSDGSPAEEPPYDPEYDGPVRAAAAAAYEGFDPGDEPLDDVIDEKTARQSSEQQAVQLLRDAFGAEKIGEV